MLRASVLSAIVVHQIPHLVDIGIDYQIAATVLGGMILMNATTDLGLSVVVAKQGAIGDLSTQWRVTTFFGVTVRDPLKCGILIGGQT